MGLLLSGFQRERPSDALQRLSFDIQRVHIDIASDKQRRRRAMRSSAAAILIVSLATFCGLNLVGDFEWLFALLYTSPFILFACGIQAAIKFYFAWSLKKNMIKLASLKEEKRSVLEEVKHTESYAVAKAILDQFDTLDDETDDRINLV
ncbi:hypothetical protein JYU34_001092 [Plutella xylostella]|uniref:Uncharacterized protein n=1 Tax=Plutella xylostella TaxID=51655 RepID=A0ABQ7R633_PLUXY|nr:hypothetical protein JYU34_001092 [Plutella xylostella]